MGEIMETSNINRKMACCWEQQTAVLNTIN